MKKMRDVVRNIKFDVCKRHQDEDLGLVFQNCKQFEEFVLAQSQVKLEIKKEWKLIKRSIDFALQKIDIPIRIELRFSDPKIDKEMYERITRKLFAVVRY